MVSVLVQVLMVVFTVLFVVVIGISFLVYTTKDYPKTVEVLNPNTLNTGDIITVGYRHMFGWVITGWSGSIWSHVGIVWKDPKTQEVFVLETAVYPPKWSGANKIPLSDWIRYNKKSDITVNRLKMKNGEKIDPDLLLNTFNEVREIYNKGFDRKWYSLYLRRKWKDDSLATKTCYELAINVLQRVGVFEKKWAGNSYYPGDVVWNKVPTTGKYEYEPPQLLDPRVYYAQVIRAL